jgi:hypothetical protein
MKIMKHAMAIIYIAIFTIKEAVYPDDSIDCGRSAFSLLPPDAESIMS